MDEYCSQGEAKPMINGDKKKNLWARSFALGECVNVEIYALVASVFLLKD